MTCAYSRLTMLKLVCYAQRGLAYLESAVLMQYDLSLSVPTEFGSTSWSDCAGQVVCSEEHYLDMTAGAQRHVAIQGSLN